MMSTFGRTAQGLCLHVSPGAANFHRRGHRKRLPADRLARAIAEESKAALFLSGVQTPDRELQTLPGVDLLHGRQRIIHG